MLKKKSAFDESTKQNLGSYLIVQTSNSIAEIETEEHNSALPYVQETSMSSTKTLNSTNYTYFKSLR